MSEFTPRIIKSIPIGDNNISKSYTEYEPGTRIRIENRSGSSCGDLFGTILGMKKRLDPQSFTNGTPYWMYKMKWDTSDEIEWMIAEDVHSDDYITVHDEVDKLKLEQKAKQSQAVHKLSESGLANAAALAKTRKVKNRFKQR